MSRHCLPLAFSALLLLSACYRPPTPPPKTQLQIRELQTRSYTAKDQKQVMKAVINALQDDAFIIKNADKELGFINASKEVDISDPNFTFWYQIFVCPEATYSKNSVMEASANISEFGPETKVRVSFQVKILNNFGNPVETKSVDDPAFYQEFFSKVDKSLYFERQGL